MIRVELPALIGRLNDMSRQALEASAALCISRQGAEITPAHLLFKLLETPFSDVRQILEHTGIDHQQLQPLVGDSLNGEVQSAEPYPSFSPLLVELMQDAWLLASTELGHTELRSGAVFLALLMNADRYLMPRVAQALAEDSIRSSTKTSLATSSLALATETWISKAVLILLGVLAVRGYSDRTGHKPGATETYK